MEISGVTNGSWLCPEPWCFHFFSDSSLLCLYTHSLCFAINQLLRFALSLAYLSHIIISSRFVITSTKLLLSSFKSVYNLHNFIRPFILYPVSLYVPLYPTKYIHLLQEIQINASYIFSSSHLSSSILIYTLLYNLLYYQPNHLRLAFSLFHSVLLVIHFNDGLPLHSLVDSKQ